MSHVCILNFCADHHVVYRIRHLVGVLYIRHVYTPIFHYAVRTCPSKWLYLYTRCLYIVALHVKKACVFSRNLLAPESCVEDTINHQRETKGQDSHRSYKYQLTTCLVSDASGVCCGGLIEFLSNNCVKLPTSTITKIAFTRTE